MRAAGDGYEMAGRNVTEAAKKRSLFCFVLAATHASLF